MKTIVLARLLSAIAIVLAVASLGYADDREGRLPRIAIDEPLSGPPAAELLLRAPDLPVPVLARVSARLESEAAQLDARLAQHAARKIPVWLTIAAPSDPAAMDRWRAALQGVLSRHAGAMAIVEIQIDDADPRLAAYAVRLAATDVRAERETIKVAIGGSGAAAAYTAELAPYLDLLVVSSDANLETADLQLQRVDPGARLAVSGMTAETNGAARMVDSQVTSLGTDVVVHSWSQSEGLTAALRALAPLAALMDGEVSALDAKAAGLVLAQGGRDVTGSLGYRLLFDERTFATYLAVLEPGVVRAAAGVPDAAGRGLAERAPAVGRPAAERGRVPPGRGDRPDDRESAAPGRTGPGQLQRRGGRGPDPAQRRLGGAAADRRGDHRPAPAPAADAGRPGPQLHRRRADGSALPPEHDRPRLRRGEHQPLLRVGR